MLWIAFIIMTSLTSLVLFLKKRNLTSISKKEKMKIQMKSIIHIKEPPELTKILKENIGKVVTFESDDLIHIYQNQLVENNRILTGKILAVDDEWIKLAYNPNKFVKKESTDQLIFRIDHIERFFLN